MELSIRAVGTLPSHAAGNVTSANAPFEFMALLTLRSTAKAVNPKLLLQKFRE